jgi:hypothetical protein
MDAVDPREAPTIELVGAKLGENNKLEPTHPVGTENHWIPFWSVGFVDVRRPIVSITVNAVLQTPSSLRYQAGATGEGR